jgi:hypothetical protein
MIGRLMYEPVAQAARAVKSELLLITPYFVPTPEEVELLKDLRGRNVRVRVLTNSLESTTQLAAHSGYVRFRPKLLQAGVELHEGSRATRKFQRKRAVRGHVRRRQLWIARKALRLRPSKAVCRIDEYRSAFGPYQRDFVRFGVTVAHAPVDVGPVGVG